MPTPFDVTRVRRAGDRVIVTAAAPDGSNYTVHLWWSHMRDLTAAQRRAAIASALKAEADERDGVDLPGYTGTLNIP